MNKIEYFSFLSANQIKKDLKSNKYLYSGLVKNIPQHLKRDIIINHLKQYCRIVHLKYKT